MTEKSYAGRPLIDKLGIKPGMRVAVLGVALKFVIRTADR